MKTWQELDQNLRSLFSHSNIGIQVPPLDPKYALIEEVLTGKRNAKGVPTFAVDKISDVRFDSSIVPWMGELQKRDRTIFRHKPPLQVLFNARNTIVPDYTTDSSSYIDRGTISELPAPVGTEILPAVEHTIFHSTMNERLRALHAEKGRSEKREVHLGDIEKVKEKTSEEVREKIRKLVGNLHDIRDTFRVGNIQATEVIPKTKVDPLFCVRIEDPRLDSSLNSLFGSAFVLAMIGRANNQKESLKSAGGVAEAAGYVAYASALSGANWRLGEMLFLGEIIYGNALTDGFKYSGGGHFRLFG